MPLEVQVVRSGEQPPRYVLKGQIDERSQLGTVVGELANGGILDLTGIERINSAGLLLWVRWVVKATEGRGISVEGISYPMAVQANQLLDLFGSARVVSCLAPYYCPRCNAARTVLVTAEELRDRAQIPPRNCNSCSTAMQFDELDDYFQFLRPQP